MQRFEVGGIVALNAPVLCLDTCSLLDMMRDPTRDTVREPERRAVYDLLTAAEGRATLIALVADQVVTEFGEHVDEVEKEAAKALQKLRDDLARIDAVAAAYGSGGPTDISHLDDHVTRARGIVDRWFAAATPAAQAGHIPANAWKRVSQARTPARKGKDSMKDCVVVETYLDVVGALRGAGLQSKVVFVSSNKKDYAGETGSALKPDLATDFAPLSIEYAPNMGAAKHLLGL
ncbi:hypothetical protein [Azospirillum argentinense]|uniref:PIN domain-containing protein n=1 Tax=Azospirillum argentinense TaxID=2970906 RepID=UPI0032DE57AD